LLAALPIYHRPAAPGAGGRVLGGTGRLPPGTIRGAERGERLHGGGRAGGDAAGAPAGADPGLLRAAPQGDLFRSPRATCILSALRRPPRCAARRPPAPESQPTAA